MTIIYSIPLQLLFPIVLAPCLLFGLFGVWITRRNNWMLEPDDNETIALAHAFTGVLYAVALGLMVVNVQSDYTEVEMVVMKEAYLAEDLYIDAEGLSGPESDEIQKLAKKYIDSVIGEWQAISGDTILELDSHAAADQLAHRIIGYVPASDKDLVVFAEMLDGVNDMMDSRRERLHLGVDGVGVITWTVVAMGALITIGMAWFYNTRSARAHYGLVGMMSMMFGLMIFLIIAMDHPLLGQFSVDNSPFVEARDGIEFWESEFGTE